MMLFEEKIEILLNKVLLFSVVVMMLILAFIEALR
nr:MAG TPA: hypothetical protein [Caudoviricetes sp.]